MWKLDLSLARLASFCGGGLTAEDHHNLAPSPTGTPMNEPQISASDCVARAREMSRKVPPAECPQSTGVRPHMSPYFDASTYYIISNASSRIQGIVLSHNIYMACLVLTLSKTAIPPVPSTGYIRLISLHRCDLSLPSTPSAHTIHRKASRPAWCPEMFPRTIPMTTYHTLSAISISH